MTLSKNITQIQQLIKQTEASCQRKPGAVLLLAVTKQQSSATIREAAQLGLREFGENYYQEALEKIIELEELNLSWHFIGPIQSNKTKGIATYFNWVHSINRLKIAQLLNEYRTQNKAPLNVCLQINIVREANKAGISPEQAKELAYAVSQLPHLKLRGLMTIPPEQVDPQKQYAILLQLNELMNQLNQQLGLDMDTLSMGMSNDLIPAIKAGSTIVRIGRALFGERTKKDN